VSDPTLSMIEMKNNWAASDADNDASKYNLAASDAD
jgi:hypothetical protein